MSAFILGSWSSRQSSSSSAAAFVVAKRLTVVVEGFLKVGLCTLINVEAALSCYCFSFSRCSRKMALRLSLISYAVFCLKKKTNRTIPDRQSCYCTQPIGDRPALAVLL